MVGRDRERCQAKTGGGNAGDVVGGRIVFGPAIGSRPIQHQTGVWVSLLPEVAEGSARDVVNKVVVDPAKVRCPGVGVVRAGVGLARTGVGLFRR